MDTRATRRSIPAAVIWGALLVLAWAALTILTGGAPAHADEHEDGPLDGLTSLVKGTVAAVTAPLPAAAADIVEPVRDVAASVVNSAAESTDEIPVAGPVVAPVVHEVASSVQAVAAPITEVLQNAPVAQVVDPIVDVVADAPVIGHFVVDIGGAEVIRDVVGIVDGAAGVVGDVAEGTVPPLVDAVDPLTPVSPETAVPSPPQSPAPPPPASAGVSAPAPDAGVPTRVRVVNDAEHGQISLSIHGSDVPATSAPARSDAPAGAPLGSPSSSSSSAPGGGSTGAAARISDDGVLLLRAEKHGSGASDDALPTSPIADTDVSPD